MLQFISPPMPHFIVCGEDTYPVGGKHPDRSRIGVFDLLVVTSGCLYLREDEVLYTVHAGEYVLLRPDRSHWTDRPCEERTHFYWLHFQTLGEWGVGAGRSPSPLTQEQPFPYPQIEIFSFYLRETAKLSRLQAITDLLRQLLQYQKESTSTTRWVQQRLFQDILFLLQEDNAVPAISPHLTLAEEAASYLRKHYQEAIDYKRMSEALHFHPNYISICMKKTFGCTPLEYVTRHRIEQAKHLLIHTNEPVGMIAELTGFGSFPYFIRCFTRVAGCTPKSFRNLYREE
jgi:AraC-like DNA-binding protein